LKGFYIILTRISRKSFTATLAPHCVWCSAGEVLRTRRFLKGFLPGTACQGKCGNLRGFAVQKFLFFAQRQGSKRLIILWFAVCGNPLFLLLNAKISSECLLRACILKFFITSPQRPFGGMTITPPNPNAVSIHNALTPVGKLDRYFEVV
jgi:hypothetical protein